ncbi:MAG: TldD/PmbA family protein [Thermodesulfovibrionales bacterium]|nr:TldD/PmbA family protein [Thermodesulfovibrionales bacterium]
MINQAILESVLKILSSQGEYADIYIEENTALQIHLEEGKIQKISGGVDRGAGLRIVKNFKTFYGHTNDLKESSLIDIAESLAKLSGSKKEESSIHIERAVPSVDFRILQRPEDIPVEKKTSILIEADRIARSSPLIKQVSITYSDTCKKIKILNSFGRYSEDERIYTTFIIRVIASENGELQASYESIGGLSGFEIFEKESPLTAAERAAKRVLMMLRARKAPGGRMPVVISSEAGGTMIHEAIGHGLEADLAQNGLSVFSYKKGEKIASELITVIDDSTLEFKRGSFRFDDEGTPAQRTVLVECGILKNYMYDIITAMKEGVNSTGNGRRESYRHKPIPRMTNTLIAPGKDSPEAIIRSVEKGIFVKKMGGGQVNTVTGDFVFEVQEGYLIEKGRISEPVRGATLQGNGPEVLKAIDMLGNDLGFSIGTCGKDSQGVPVSDGMPTLRIPEMIVGGIIQPV